MSPTDKYPLRPALKQNLRGHNFTGYRHVQTVDSFYQRVTEKLLPLYSKCPNCRGERVD